MALPVHPHPFESIAHRAAYTYLVSLTPFATLSSGCVEKFPVEDLEASGRQFHAFLRTLFTHLYQSPGQFGLPLDADLCIQGDEPDPKQHKQDVRRKLDKPKEWIERGLPSAFSRLILEFETWFRQGSRLG
jgi:hypothetical protein